MELSIAAAGTPEDSPLCRDGNSHEVRGPRKPHRNEDCKTSQDGECTWSRDSRLTQKAWPHAHTAYYLSYDSDRACPQFSVLEGNLSTQKGEFKKFVKQSQAKGQPS